jgi:hypothetical protein
MKTYINVRSYPFTYTLSRVLVTNNAGSGLDEWIY